MASFLCGKEKINSVNSSVGKVWKVEFMQKVYYYGRVFEVEKVKI